MGSLQQARAYSQKPRARIITASLKLLPTSTPASSLTAVSSSSETVSHTTSKTKEVKEHVKNGKAHFNWHISWIRIKSLLKLRKVSRHSQALPYEISPKAPNADKDFPHTPSSVVDSDQAVHETIVVTSEGLHPIVSLKFSESSGSLQQAHEVHTVEERADAESTVIPSPPETTKEAESLLAAQFKGKDLSICTLGSEREPSPSDPPVEAASITTPPWKSNIKIFLHTNDRNQVRCAKLDTGSDFNIISQRVIESLKLGDEVQVYKGRPCLPLGDPIQPSGQIQLDWHVFGKTRTYNDVTFLVFPEKYTEEFDVLIGEKVLKKHQFYLVNDKVMILG